MESEKMAEQGFAFLQAMKRPVTPGNKCDFKKNRGKGHLVITYN